MTLKFISIVCPRVVVALFLTLFDIITGNVLIKVILVSNSHVDRMEFILSRTVKEVLRNGRIFYGHQSSIQVDRNIFYSPCEYIERILISIQPAIANCLVLAVGDSSL